MTQNPFINALVAATYIASVVFCIGALEGGQEPETLFMPMAMLSVLVFSVALMGYLFFYQPLLLILSGKHTEGAQFFLKTLGTFAVIVVILLIVAFAV